MYFEEDEGLQELGGAAYLVKLQGASISSFAAKDYAQMIYDLAIRRELILLGEEIVSNASNIQTENGPEDQIVEAEQKLYSLAEEGDLSLIHI